MYRIHEVFVDSSIRLTCCEGTYYVDDVRLTIMAYVYIFSSGVLSVCLFVCFSISMQCFRVTVRRVSLFVDVYLLKVDCHFWATKRFSQE